MGRIKVMISISEEFLAEIDKVAKEENRSRSELLRGAARLYLKIRKVSVSPGQDPRIQKAIEVQDMLASKDSLTEWDSTAEIRRWKSIRLSSFC